jgi:Xaa-Pro dipeptidase
MTQELKPLTTAPDEDEMSGRLAKVREMMAAQQLDYYISYDPVNVYYLTNFYNYVHERPFILIIGKTGTPKFLVPKLEIPHVQSRAKCDLELVQYFEYPAPEGDNWYDYYQPLIDEKARVGVESAMTLEIYDQTPGNKIKTDIIDEVRFIKTEFEIGRYVHACGVLKAGFSKLLEICRPGAMMIELYSALTQEMMGKSIMEIPELNPLITTVKGVAQPPSISHDPHNFTNLFLPMENGGPHVTLLAGQVDGCGVELERTFFLGTVPEAAKKPFNDMLEARAMVYEQLKPGANMGVIDKKVNEFFKKAGYEENLLHRTGHGMGITGHEGPFIAEGYDRELEAGMMVSVEPGIYFPGLGGFRHSDTVLITEDGYAKLTNAPDAIEDLTISL